MKRLLAMLLLLALVVLPAEADGPLRLGVLAVRPEAQVLAQWQPLAMRLEAALGRRIELSAYDFAGMDDAVARKAVDIVIASPGHYIRIKHQSGLSAPLATLVTQEGTQELAAYGGVIFTRSDLPAITSLSDLAGRRIAAVDMKAFGGYMAQAFEMLENGVPMPGKDDLLLTGLPLDNVLDAVLAGRADAGFVRTGVIEAMTREGKLDPGRIRIIHRQALGSYPYVSSTRLYPEWPVAMLPHIDEALARSLTIALLALPHDDPALRAAGIHGFTIPADYDGVENMLRRLRIAPFDVTPEVTLADLWRHYAGWIVALAILLLLLIGAGVGLLMQYWRLRQGQQALQDSEARLATILDNASAYIYMKDVNGRYLFANRMVRELWGGVTESEVAGRADEDFFDAQTAAQLYNNDRRVLVGGETIRCEETNTSATSGATATYWSVKLPLRHKDGSIYALCGISTDISERKRNEAVVLARLHLMQYALDHTLDELLEETLNEAERLTGSSIGFYHFVDDDQQNLTLQNWSTRTKAEFCNAQGKGRHYPIAEAGVWVDCVRDGKPVIHNDYASLPYKKGLPEGHAEVVRELVVPVLRGDKIRAILGVGNKRADYSKQDVETVTMVADLAWEVVERLRAEQALREQEQRFRAIAEGVPDAIFIKDTKGRYLLVNSAVTRFLDKSAEDIIGRDDTALFPPEEARVVMQGDRGVMDSGKTSTYEERVTTADGVARTFYSTKGPLRDAEGNVTGLFGVARDITERKQVETRLKLAASVFSHAREAITITDADASIIEVNDAFTRITGYSREEALRQNPRILKSGRHSKKFYADMWRSLKENGYWSGEIWNRRKNGEAYAEILTISAVRDAAGNTQNYVALFTDITYIKEHQQQLEHIAHSDMLTGLPNRVLLADRMRQAIAHCQRRKCAMAVAYLDLDGFKAVNDQYGHDVGDDLLVTIAQRMNTVLREGDTLARIGGDEFVGVLVDLDQPQDCEPVLGRLLQAASDPVAIRHLVLHVSASIGVTLYPQDGVDADLLLRHADQAMYQAKQAGRNRYHLFDVAQDKAVKAKRESLEHIQRALNKREFMLYYQPKANMKTGEVTGAEALLRWRHPERGLLPDAGFLAITNNHPISVQLGEWVIDTALTQLAEWHAAGLDIQVSVNIGALQLLQSNFAERLSVLLAAHPDVHPSRLQLELLETSALEDMAQVSEVMRICHELGVSFALDDFGTGYSSLTYLKRLPAELLKIDQSFVRDMLEDPEALAIVDGVIGLATAFRREVIAEGVETTAHGELLLTLGCELAQGYAIARPMPGVELPGWVAAWRPDATWAAWREHHKSHEDLAVVYSGVELRHWLHALEEFLADRRREPPPMDPHACRFGRWQDSKGRALYGGQPVFREVEALHERVHATGSEVVELHTQGRQDEAKVRLQTLYTVRDELLEKLRELMRKNAV